MVTEYDIALLQVLYQKYPKSVRKSVLAEFVPNKDPLKLDRQIAYLEEKGLIERDKIIVAISVPFYSIEHPLSVTKGLKITAKGIDTLAETGKKSEQGALAKELDKPVAFISASFDDSANELIAWVRNRAHKSGLSTVWLREHYVARPTVEKIDQAISDSDCVIQVLSSIVFTKTGEAGWLGNELGMAYKSAPKGNVAIFAEKGYEASGLAGAVIQRKKKFA